MSNCNCHTEINRDGSGQLQRYLKALDPTYAPVDDRSLEEILVFAKKYAAQIRFYDVPDSTIANTPDPKKLSWREFFRRDMAVVIASVAVTDLQSFKREFEEVRDRLELQTTPEVFGALFNPILGMLKKIDHWYTVAIPENPLYRDLVLAINSELRQQAMNIMSYKKEFNVVDPNVQLKMDLDGVENPDIWGFNETIDVSTTLYEGTSKEDKIKFAALNVEDIFYSFYSFLSQLINDSDKYLDYAIQQFPGHQPHMALFITFLELFRKAQDQVNGLTERMLNFYYRDVLRLAEKPSVPDKVHMVFELAKDVAEYDLAEGTALTAGNDNSGALQLYKTEEDLVINQAKVKELKTIFVEKTNLDKVDADQVVHTLYARPVANSLDGFGEKFTDPNPKWPTFGIGSPPDTDPKNVCEAIALIKDISTRNDQAQIGFAIASPQLLMQGGKRLIEIAFSDTTFSKLLTLENAGNTNLFEIWFTGEKEWFKVDQVMTDADRAEFTKFLHIGLFNSTAAADGKGAAYYLDTEKKSISLYLPLSEPGVIEYDEKLHKQFLFSTSLPVMMIRLNPVIDLKASDYHLLSISGMSLRVKVGSLIDVQPEDPDPSDDDENEALKPHFDGLNKLLIKTETGIQEVGKPFDPFSPYPAFGKFFYVGSGEVFNKPLGKLAIQTKKTIDEDSGASDSGVIFAASTRTVEYGVSVLKQRNWVPLTSLFFIPTMHGKFSQTTLNFDILNQGTFDGNFKLLSHSKVTIDRQPIDPVIDLEPGLEKGFVRIANLRTTGADMEARQTQAAGLEIAEVYFSYDSTLNVLENGVDEFYHVYPFGTAQIYTTTNLNSGLSASIGFNRINLIGKGLLRPFDLKEDDPLVVDAHNLLLPHFTYLGPYEIYKPASVQAVYTGDVNSTGGIFKLRSLTKSRFATSMKRDQETFRLMLNASGLRDKLEGGANQYSALAQEEGLLFIGLENLKPLQSVSLLFQFAEGSAENEDDDPPEIHWSYLTNNEWRPMKAEDIIGDGTFGFQTTGIVKISIPQDATLHNTICTDGLCWLCASVTKDSNRIPQLIDVVAQAVEAVFEDNHNDQSHFDKALPAGTISALQVTAPEVSKVKQPFASFDGKHREIGKEFYTRVSERLRHKHRAVTPWDYEHIVLDRFPSIYKVKCITHTDPNCLCRKPVPVEPDSGQTIIRFKPNDTQPADQQAAIETVRKVTVDLGQNSTLDITRHHDSNSAMSIAVNERRANAVADLFVQAGIGNARIKHVIATDGEKDLIELSVEGAFQLAQPNTDDICCGPQVAPGHVLLIPIANLKNRNAVNPLQPKTARRTLLAIESYLKKLTSPFVHVHAKNPVYEQVLVFFRVKFFPQFEKGYYMKKLNEEIVQFLTPWAFDENAEVKFGQKIYASSIINFIEERKYVDFITDFLMVVCKDECCPPLANAEPRTPPPNSINAVVTFTSKPDGNNTLVAGSLKDKATNAAFGGVTVTVGVTNVAVMTDVNGNFSVDTKGGDGTLNFSKTGFKPVPLKIDDNNDVDITFLQDLTTEVDEWEVLKGEIQKICGCSGIEYLLEDEMDFPGDIVAKPSTQRSILVSAPHHIIVPYEDPPSMTPCERKAQLKGKIIVVPPRPVFVRPEVARPVTPMIAPAGKIATITKPVKRTPTPNKGGKSTGRTGKPGK